MVLLQTGFRSRCAGLACALTNCLLLYVTLDCFQRIPNHFFVIKYGLKCLRQIRVVDEDERIAYDLQDCLTEPRSLSYDSLIICVGFYRISTLVTFIVCGRPAIHTDLNNVL